MRKADFVSCGLLKFHTVEIIAVQWLDDKLFRYQVIDEDADPDTNENVSKDLLTRRSSDPWQNL